MATKNENKQNVNENVKANNVNNESANVESAKVENESNESAKVDNVKNESNESSESSESNATDESKPQATEPTAEEIAAAKVETKHEAEIKKSYKLDLPKEVEKTKFAGAYVLGVYRVDENRKEKKNGDKTFYKIFYGGKIYDGWNSTEFCDEIGIERKHRGKNTPKVETLLDKLQALKAAIEAIGSEEENFVNFAKIVASKIESEKLESDRTAFVAKYETLISALPYLTTAVATTLHGDDFVKMALKLGYKFADTPTDTTESK